MGSTFLDIQATALSVFGMGYRLVSAGVLMIVGYFGKIQLEYGFLASAILCMIMYAFFRINEHKYA